MDDRNRLFTDLDPVFNDLCGGPADIQAELFETNAVAIPE
jgi:hypothetical protein